MDYSYKPDWQSCFCQYYHTTCDDAGWRSRSPEQNCASALDLIARGEMRGYLAYAEGKCVGWCNVNALSALPRLAVFPELAQFAGPSGVIICFVIHPEYRRKGAARRLLRAAVEGFRRDGFACVLGLPFEWKDRPELQYHGSRAMFTEAGFATFSEDERGPLMVLDFAKA